MNLFVFGIGYSSRYFMRTRQHLFARADGSVRSEAKIAALKATGICALQFTGEDAAPAIAARLEAADAVLVSIPPQGDSDCVLDHFGAQIAGASKLRTIIYLSTIGVYGGHDGAWIDEDAALNPSSPRNVARARIEQQWLALGRAANKRVHILRLAGIYGPGQNQIEKLRRGTAQRIVKPGQVFNRIHVEDIARAIEAALKADAGGIWNVADDEPAAPQDVLAFAAGLAGLDLPPEIDFATAQLNPMARSFYGDNKRVSNTRMKRVLGVQLAYPTYREGLRAIWQDAAKD